MKTKKSAAAAALALLLPIAACAQWHDDWKGKDKRGHFKASAGMAFAGGLVLESNAWVMGGCMAVDLGWEIRNRRLLGQPVSWKDMVANLGGCAGGLALERGVEIVVQRMSDRTVVAIRWEN